MHPGIQSWKYLFVYAFNAFSIPLLLKTLFSPWEMDNTKGGDWGFLEKFVFAILSRILGLVARVIFIILGLLFSLFIIILFPIFFFLPIKIEKKSLENLPSFGSFLSYGNTYFLNKHGKDVEGNYSLKIYGKDKALRMVERGLSKDTNHNVLLIGETGVGKKTLISYLGLLGQSGLSFDGIRHHRVVELFLEGMVSENLDKCLYEAARAGNVILVIKNIHLYESVYEKLLPYLNMKHLGIIVTTDFVNYDQILKRHTEFVSKFEKVNLEPTNFEDTVAIVSNNANLARTPIKIDAINEIVKLTDKFMESSPQPIKSLQVLEELRTLGREITILDVRQIISDKINMPIGDIEVGEKKVLKDLENIMRAKIIGQEEAVKDVSDAIKRLRTGVAEHNRPASFLFLGPTGVGKTYTAKILAESYFGRKNAMIRFDMTEFSLPGSLDVFSERLASVIEEMPLSLVFFDELEKSNTLVRNLLLQVLDEGRLTRESGRVVSFRDSIIIATSNAGSSYIIENRNVEKKILINSLIKDGIFAAEFLNRFSDIILFKTLDEGNVRKITHLLLLELALRIWEDKKIKLIISEALIDKIAKAGFDPDFGARPIKRAIEEIVENKITEYIVSGNTEGVINIV